MHKLKLVSSLAMLSLAVVSSMSKSSSAARNPLPNRAPTAVKPSRMTSLFHLTKWAGLRPSDRLLGTTFWEVPELRDGIIRAAGEPAYRALAQLSRDGTSPRVVARDGFLAASTCDVKACGTKAAFVVVRPDRGMIYICQTVQASKTRAPMARWATSARDHVDINGACLRRQEIPPGPRGTMAIVGRIPPRILK